MPYKEPRKHIEATRRKYKRYYQKNKDWIIARRKTWRDNNKQKVKEQNKRSHTKTKKLVISHYSNNSNSCACCGQMGLEFLTIDHINGGGTQHLQQIRVSGGNFYTWLKRGGFPSGFQVLCWNCNCARSRMDDKICPHKKMVALYNVVN